MDNADDALATIRGLQEWNRIIASALDDLFVRASGASYIRLREALVCAAHEVEIIASDLRAAERFERAAYLASRTAPEELAQLF